MVAHREGGWGQGKLMGVSPSVAQTPAIAVFCMMR